MARIASPRGNRLNRRRVLGAAGAGLALTAAGCGQSAKPKPAGGAQPASGQPQTGGSLTSWLVTGNLPSLDPQQTPSAWTMYSCGAALSRILRFQTGADTKVGEDRSVESDLGASVESPDAVTWIVKLRPDAKFHNVAPVNGHSVEAEDVKASFVRALGGAKNPFRGFLATIMDASQIETPARDTVTFKLKYPYSPFRKSLASTNYGWIFPREALTGDYDPATQMIGSGPFLFDHLTPDAEVAFRRNPNWFEQPRPFVDSMRYPIITDTAQQGAQFTSGHLDILQPPINDVGTLLQRNPKTVNVTAHPSRAGAFGSSSGILIHPGSMFACVVRSRWRSTVRLWGRPCSPTTTTLPSIWERASENGR